MPTQFSRALSQLDIRMIPANSPRAKGRIERLWGTLQKRWTSDNPLYQLLPPVIPGRRGGLAMIEERLDGTTHIRFKSR